MAHITADRVKQTSTSIGIGSIELTGSLIGFRNFSSVLTTTDTFWYAIASAPGSEWEVGLGTYSALNTITRTTVLSSSNAGAAVVFSAGTKEVFITAAAGKFLQANAAGSYGSFSAGTITAALTGNASTATTANNVSGIVAIANGGTGTATPSLVAGTNITISGSFPNQTINSSGGGGGGFEQNFLLMGA